MAKVMKIVGRILGITGEWLLILIIFLAFAIRSTAFQTYMAKQAAAFLSKELHTTVQIDEIEIIFFDKAAMDGFLLLDEKKDTLVYVNTLYITVDDFSLSESWFKLGQAELDKGRIEINRDKTSGRFNFAFLVDYFSPKKKKKKKSQVELSLRKLLLSDIGFAYSDFQKPKASYGLDYNYLNFKGFYLTASQFRFSKKGEISLKLDGLRFKEQCGLQVNDLQTRLIYSKKELSFHDLQILTPISDFQIPTFQLLTHSEKSFNYFADSVRFNAQIKKSRVSLKDVSYFVPALEGMDEVLFVRTNIQKPLKELELQDLSVSFGKKTFVEANIKLPDFRHIKEARIQQSIKEAYVSMDDLKRIRMPKSYGKSQMRLDPVLQKLKFLSLRSLNITGKLNELVVKLLSVKTGLGELCLKKGISVRGLAVGKDIHFSPVTGGNDMLEVKELDLGVLAANSTLGKLNAKLSLEGFIHERRPMEIKNIKGMLNGFDLMAYHYTSIHLDGLDYADNQVVGKMHIDDPNLKMSYSGKINFKKQLLIDAEANIQMADLHALKITQADSTLLSSSISANFTGSDLKTIAGMVKLENFNYREKRKTIQMKLIQVNSYRGAVDSLIVNSDFAHLSLSGKYSFEHLTADFGHELNKVFPAFIENPSGAAPLKLRSFSDENNFECKLTLHDIQPVLNIFVPQLQIAPGSSLTGKFNNRSGILTAFYNGNYINYGSVKMANVRLNQRHDAENVKATLALGKLYLGDSTALDSVAFEAEGMGNILNSFIRWEQNNQNDSKVIWQSDLRNKGEIGITVQESFFSINQQRWDIKEKARMKILNERIVFVGKDSLKFVKGNQCIALSGIISKDNSENLSIRLHNIDLNDMGKLLALPAKMEGKLNGHSAATGLYSNPVVAANLSIDDFYVNDQFIGYIKTNSSYKASDNKIMSGGSLCFPDSTKNTFDFSGTYNLMDSADALDFRLKFNQTDLSFVNAFMDTTMLSNLKGAIEGVVKVDGSVQKPEVTSEKLFLKDVSAKMNMLGVNLRFNGGLRVKKDGMFLSDVQVYDEEKNKGKVFGFVKHNNYSDWKFNVQMDFHDEASKGKGNADKDYRFLAMNTSYKEGEMYYGKAYVKGMVNVRGTQDNVKLLLDLETKEGTVINFPMFGATEVSEEQGFITFKGEEKSGTANDKKTNLTGIELDMNFRMTPEAKLKIIFNEFTGDELFARGDGDILMKMDNLGDMTMNGTYRVKNGIYNFAMGVFKQSFFIEEGGTINWTGDPIAAKIDLKTYLEVIANLSEISPDQIQGTSMPNQKILCYLALTESMLAPTIGFDIQAPKADETGKALLSRITSDNDELRRQFISLLFWNRFQPLKGSTAGGGSAAIDLVTNQINSLLSQVSKEFKLNVNLDSDELTKENTYEMVFSKGFLDDRVIFTGSFGVENSTAEKGSGGSNQLIGDVGLEVLLSENGNVRFNVFNESNDNAIIQDKNLGLFTQGAGLHYKEDFDHFGNFKLAQYFLDIFRKKENKRYPIKKKRKQTPVDAHTEGRFFILPSDRFAKKLTAGNIFVSNFLR